MRRLGFKEWAVLSVLGLLYGLPGTSFAQSATGIVVDRLAPMPGRRGNVVNLATSEIHPHLATDLGLTMHYVDTPLRLIPVGTGGGANDVVQNQLKADLAGTIGLFDWADVTLAMPLVLHQSGGDLAALGEPGQAVGGAAAGDLRVVPKLQILDAKRALGFGVAVMTPVYLPTGDSGSFNSEGNVRGGATLVVDWRLAEILVTANVGYELRKKNTALNYRSDDVIPWGIGGEVGVGFYDARVFANLFGAVPTVKGLDPRNLNRASSERPTGPVEALLGVRAPLPLGLSATLAGGMGLTADVGAPEYRLLAALSYELDVFAPAMRVREENTDMMQVSDAAPVTPKAPEPVVLAAEPTPIVEPVLAPEPAPLPVAVLQADRIEINERMQFKTGSDVLLPVSLPIIASVAKVLREHPELLRLVIEGHTDNQGTPKKNWKLSKARAEAVMRALIAEGVEAERLAAQGFGASRPLVPNKTPKQRYINRRVELRIESSSQSPVAVTQH